MRRWSFWVSAASLLEPSSNRLIGFLQFGSSKNSQIFPKLKSSKDNQKLFNRSDSSSYPTLPTDTYKFQLASRICQKRTLTLLNTFFNFHFLTQNSSSSSQALSDLLSSISSTKSGNSPHLGPNKWPNSQDTNRLTSVPAPNNSAVCCSNHKAQSIADR